MVAEYPEQQTNDTLRYLQGLFNVKKFILEHKTSESNKTIPNEEQFKVLQERVDAVMRRSKYNKVDLGQLFGFMQIGKTA